MAGCEALGSAALDWAAAFGCEALDCKALFAEGAGDCADGCADSADGADWFAPAAWFAPVALPATVLVAELTTPPAALVTAETVPLRGSPEAEDFAAPEAGPLSAEVADVAPEAVPERSSPVAAWACLEKSSRRKIIAAAASANCAALMATRYASSCGIDSSYPQRRWPRTLKSRKTPDQPYVAVEDEAFCTATTVHDRQ